MRIELKQLEQFLQDSNLVPQDKLAEAVAEAKKDNKDLGVLLLEKSLIKEAELQKTYAYILGFPFVDLSREAVPMEILQIVPELIAKKYNIVSFEKKRYQSEGGHVKP